jgi:membrane-associated protein
MFETFAMFGISPEAIAQAGLWLIAAIIFAESGLLIGFFLPGDTLLIAAGIIAAAPEAPFTIQAAIFTIAVAAIIGDNVGYTIGQYSGKRLFKKKDGILFRQEYMERAEKFYEKHGGKTIIMARFVPVVRTFAPMVAGIGKMPRGKFFLYNVVGGILWATTLPLLGYWVGSKIPHIGEYIEYALFAVIFLSLAPAVWHIAKDPRSRAMVATQVKRLFRRKHHHAKDADDEIPKL